MRQQLKDKERQSRSEEEDEEDEGEEKKDCDGEKGGGVEDGEQEKAADGGVEQKASSPESMTDSTDGGAAEMSGGDAAARVVGCQWRDCGRWQRGRRRRRLDGFLDKDETTETTGHHLFQHKYSYSRTATPRGASFYFKNSPQRRARASTRHAPWRVLINRTSNMRGSPC